MPNTRTSDEISAGPLAGTELIRVVQSGSNAKATASQFSVLATAPFAASGNGNGADLVYGVARYVASIAELRTLLKTGLGRAVTLGYAASGDGGGGSLYLYDPTDTTSTDNGGSVIVAGDGGRWKLVLGSDLRLRQFGAKGDNSTDDTAACLAAIASGAKSIDGEMLTYKVSSSVARVFGAGVDFTFKRVKLSSNGIPDNSNILSLGGSSTPTQTLNISAAAAGSLTITLSSGSVNPGDKLQVRSLDKWNDVAVNQYPTVTMGEWAEAASIAGLVVTLKAPLLYDYSTSPVVDVMPLAGTITVEDVECISDNTSFLHTGTSISYASTIAARRVRGKNCSNAGYAASYFINATDEDCGNYDPNASLGFAYGVVISNTSRSHISVRPRGRGCRHITAHGGYAGVIAETSLNDPQGDNQFEGVVDAHAAVDKQTVIFGNTSQFTSANGKLISSQARRLTVIGAQSDAISTGIAWTPACTAYPASASFIGCRVKCKSNALQVNIATTQNPEYIEVIGGSYEAALFGSSSGDAIQVTHSSNLNTGTGTGATPGTIQRVVGTKVKYAGFRGFYFSGGNRGQKCIDIDWDGNGSSGTAAGSRPFYINPNTAGDVGNVTLRGVLDGGVDYNAEFYNCDTIDADVLSRNFVTDVYYNNQNAASDALNRYNLRARMKGDGSTPQRFGTVTANGTTAVVTSNKFARSGSRIRFQLVTPGGTLGVPYASASSTGSFSLKSTLTTDTSVYAYEILNPITGP